MHCYPNTEVLQSSVRHLSENWVPKHASLVICILAGNQDGLITGAHANRLKYALCSQNCPELHGKPKILIIRPLSAHRVPKWPPLFNSTNRNNAANPPPAAGKIIDHTLINSCTNQLGSSPRRQGGSVQLEINFVVRAIC